MGPVSDRVGVIVRYVLPENSSNAGEIRPAIIVKDNSDGNDQSVNLQIFADASDGKQYASGVVYASDRKYDANNFAPGTWHYLS